MHRSMIDMDVVDRSVIFRCMGIILSGMSVRKGVVKVKRYGPYVSYIREDVFGIFFLWDLVNSVDLLTYERRVRYSCSTSGTYSTQGYNGVPSDHSPSSKADYADR